LGVFLGVEGALFQDPAMVDKEKCDAKRIGGVEQAVEPRSAKDQPKISRDETRGD
jgi:hypothetical protein